MTSNYNGSTGPCEPLTVKKASSSTATTIHNVLNHGVGVTSVPLGSTVDDSATVTGTAFGTPTGNVTFTWFTASSECGGNSVGAGTVALAGGVAHPSTAFGPLATGSYSFRATYNGDTNYTASTGLCEPLTVTKADTSTATTIHNVLDHTVGVTSVPLGSTVDDSATVTGTAFGAPTGTVTFTWFTAASNCTGNSVGAGTIPLVAGVAHPSTAFGPLAAGSYSFRATYSGDANYNTSTGPCEPLSVGKADTSTATTIHNVTNHNVGVTTVPLGSLVDDSATVTGTGFGAPTGTVTFTWFTASTACTGNSTGAGTIPLVAGCGASVDRVRSAGRRELLVPGDLQR